MQLIMSEEEATFSIDPLEVQVAADLIASAPIKEHEQDAYGELISKMRLGTYEPRALQLSKAQGVEILRLEPYRHSAESLSQAIEELRRSEEAMSSLLLETRQNLTELARTVSDRQDTDVKLSKPILDKSTDLVGTSIELLKTELCDMINLVLIGDEAESAAVPVPDIFNRILVGLQNLQQSMNDSLDTTRQHLQMSLSDQVSANRVEYERLKRDLIQTFGVAFADYDNHMRRAEAQIANLMRGFQSNMRTVSQIFRDEAVRDLQSQIRHLQDTQGTAVTKANDFIEIVAGSFVGNVNNASMANIDGIRGAFNALSSALHKAVEEISDNGVQSLSSVQDAATSTLDSSIKHVYDAADGIKTKFEQLLDAFSKSLNEFDSLSGEVVSGSHQSLVEHLNTIILQVQESVTQSSSHFKSVYLEALEAALIGADDGRIQTMSAVSTAKELFTSRLETVFAAFQKSASSLGEVAEQAFAGIETSLITRQRTYEANIKNDVIALNAAWQERISTFAADLAKSQDETVVRSQQLLAEKTTRMREATAAKLKEVDKRTKQQHTHVDRQLKSELTKRIIKILNSIEGKGNPETRLKFENEVQAVLTELHAVFSESQNVIVQGESQLVKTLEEEIKGYTQELTDIYKKESQATHASTTEFTTLAEERSAKLTDNIAEAAIDMVAVLVGDVKTTTDGALVALKKVVSEAADRDATRLQQLNHEVSTQLASVGASLTSAVTQSKEKSQNAFESGSKLMSEQSSAVLEALKSSAESYSEEIRGYQEKTQQTVTSSYKALNDGLTDQRASVGSTFDEAKARSASQMDAAKQAVVSVTTEADKEWAAIVADLKDQAIGFLTDKLKVYSGEAEQRMVEAQSIATNQVQFQKRDLETMTQDLNRQVDDATRQTRTNLQEAFRLLDEQISGQIGGVAANAKKTLDEIRGGLRFVVDGVTRNSDEVFSKIVKSNQSMLEQTQTSLANAFYNFTSASFEHSRQLGDIIRTQVTPAIASADVALTGRVLETAKLANDLTSILNQARTNMCENLQTVHGSLMDYLGTAISTSNTHLKDSSAKFEEELTERLTASFEEIEARLKAQEHAYSEAANKLEASIMSNLAFSDKE